MLKIRLQRVGRKNDPSFRVVVTDSKNGPKSGRFIEVLGSYDARKSEPALKTDRIKYWLSVGAQTSGTVNNLLVGRKVIEGRKVDVSSKRRPDQVEIKGANTSDQPPVSSADDTADKEETTKTNTVAETNDLKPKAKIQAKKEPPAEATVAKPDKPLNESIDEPTSKLAEKDKND